MDVNYVPSESSTPTSIFDHYRIRKMQEVIIYRSPAEAAIWDMLLSDVGFAFIVSLIVFLVSVLLVDETVRKQRLRFRHIPVIFRAISNGYVSLAFGLAAASFCSWWLLG